jgi:enoyl-CoA hydratase/carnithine racemase
MMNELSSAERGTGGALASEVLRQHLDRGVLTMTLARPEKRNALNTALMDALLRAIDDADAQTDVRAIVIAGAGPGFCAGADLSEFQRAGDDGAARMQARTALSAQVLLRLDALRKPVVAAVHGAAIGAGAALALACDLMVMGEGARLAYPEARHGMVPALVLANLVGRVGYRTAFQWLMIGDPISAIEAVRHRLANCLVPDDRVVEEATALAARLAGLDPAVATETKKLLLAASELDFAGAIRNGVEWSRVRRGL